MSTVRATPTRRGWASWLRTPAALSSAVLLASVLLANGLYVLGVRSNNPLLYHSGLGSPERGFSGAPHGIGHGGHTLDANDG